mgnify:CR=1 FL=1
MTEKIQVRNDFRFRKAPRKQERRNDYSRINSLGISEAIEARRRGLDK